MAASSGWWLGCSARARAGSARSSASVAPISWVRNGVVWVSRKKASTPSEYRSLRPSMMPRSCHSGAMYSGVPHTLPEARVPSGCMMPKSISLSSPTAVSRTFSALTSQCTNSRECTKPRICASRVSVRCTSRYDIGWRAATSHRSSPLTTSIVM